MDISRRIKIRHLEAFVEVARQKSVGRAGDHLVADQPAVTRTIREPRGDCRRRVGRARWSRHQAVTSRRGVSVSCRIGPGGGARRNFRACQCRHVVRAAGSHRGAADRFGHGDAGRCGGFSRLRTEESFAGDYRENWVLLDQLRKGDLDLVMGRMPAPDMMTSLRFEPLYRDRVIFVVAEGPFRLPASARSPPDILGRYPVLVPPEGSIIHPYVEQGDAGTGDGPSGRRLSKPCRTASGGRSCGPARRYGSFRAALCRPRSPRENSLNCRSIPGSTLGAVGLISREADRQHDAAAFFADILQAAARMQAERIVAATRIDVRHWCCRTCLNRPETNACQRSLVIRLSDNAFKVLQRLCASA
jgi:LysR family pca operon transcriptional activator